MEGCAEPPVSQVSGGCPSAILGVVLSLSLVLGVIDLRRMLLEVECIFLFKMSQFLSM